MSFKTTNKELRDALRALADLTASWYGASSEHRAARAILARPARVVGYRVRWPDESTADFMAEYYEPGGQFASRGYGVGIEGARAHAHHQAVDCGGGTVTKLVVR